MAAIVHGMDNAAYRAKRELLSYTESKLLDASAASYRYAMDHPEVWTPSAAQAFGTMVHTATLEPHAFDTRYRMLPTLNKNTNAWRDLTAGCLADGVLPCTTEDRAAAFACANSVLTHETVGPLFRHGHPEVSVFWDDKLTGVACKARIDWVNDVNPALAILLDLKTTADASREAFRRSVVNYLYHRQADWYEVGYATASGAPVSPMLFVAVESKPPYLCAAYTLDRWFMAQAAKDNHRVRSLYKACVEMGEWPGYDPAITDLTAPRFALDEEMRALLREEEAYS